jgi:hypothetical protein
VRVDEVALAVPQGVVAVEGDDLDPSCWVATPRHVGPLVGGEAG